jgi:hypothetical protein
MKVCFQPRTSIFTERDNNLIGKIRLIIERRKKYFYETPNIKDDVQIRVEAICRVLNEQIGPPTKEEVREIIIILENNKSQGGDNISAELIEYGDMKKHGMKFTHYDKRCGSQKKCQRTGDLQISPAHKEDKLQCKSY